jgi:hypothetical protein
VLRVAVKRNLPPASRGISAMCAMSLVPKSKMRVLVAAAFQYTRTAIVKSADWASTSAGNPTWAPMASSSTALPASSGRCAINSGTVATRTAAEGWLSPASPTEVTA